jgi:hypothetical protein
VQDCNGQIPVCIANLSGVTQVLKQNTILRTVEDVKVLPEPEEQESSPRVTTSESESESWLEDVLQANIEALSEPQKQAVRRLLQDSKSVFATTKTDLGRTNIYPHTIFVGDNAPIREPPRRFPRHKREAAEELQRMINMDVIEPSDSPWALPVCLVAKKDGARVLHRLSSIERRNT